MGRAYKVYASSLLAARVLALCLPVCFARAAPLQAVSSQTVQRIFEWSFESQKSYADPFNDVDVDVIFERSGQSWRVPAFWRGGRRWTVRFAPPTPGEYTYHLEATDRGNPALNGHPGHVRISAYAGSNTLLRHGMLRISANHRYFEHADGTPFYWLGDTWWSGLSTRLSWEGFKTLAQDRRAKGFTVVQIVAGLVPTEERVPTDAGACNEGGCVWEAGFTHINPHYFDSADRRIQYLLDQGLVPAIVGGWRDVLSQMGVTKMKQHWRYLVARYGVYPVFWIAGGEVVDPPADTINRVPSVWRRLIVPGWSEVARYIRTTDPYHHPLTVHQFVPPLDVPLEEPSLTDFDLIQSGHTDWPSIATSVAQLDMRYARTSGIKPVVQGEIGYEQFIGKHYEDFQRTAFWLSMLDGAAGHTYGANAVWESYSADKPFQRMRWSFLTWQEGMHFAGSYQVGLGAKLLRQYRWWRFVPHPDWVTPRGTTLLEPHAEIHGFELGPGMLAPPAGREAGANPDEPAGEWQAHQGSFHGAYAAGIPGEVRVIYIPNFGSGEPPTVRGLEPGVRYHAFFWEPALGIRVDLGRIARPAPAAKIFEDTAVGHTASAWSEVPASPTEPMQELTVLKSVKEKDAVASVEIPENESAALLLRYQDVDNYVAAVYSADDRTLSMRERQNGKDGAVLGTVALSASAKRLRLSAAVRADKGIASIGDGERTETTPIVSITDQSAGSVGLLYSVRSTPQMFGPFELRASPEIPTDDVLQRKLYDAQGRYRGTLAGGETGPPVGGFAKMPSWDSFGREKDILLDAWRPERLPTPGDWVLILEADKSRRASTSGQDSTESRLDQEPR